MTCKICSHDSKFRFTKLVLNKYQVKYFQCTHCSFIQTEEPYWLDEAYTSAITSLDIGLVYRNIYLAPIIQSLISCFFDRNKRFLDFGGGYGLFVRMMRDKGFDFYRQDKFCDNLFAKFFDIEDQKAKSDFEAITAFELFEHLPNPYEGIEQMLALSENIIFSTDLIPDGFPIEQWEYLVPEVGQHVSLYHYKSLLEIGKKLKLNVYSNKVNIHVLSAKKINPWFFRQLTRRRISVLFNQAVSRTSFLETDYQFIKKKLSI